jgi:hypothetical protein
MSNDKYSLVTAALEAELEQNNWLKPYIELVFEQDAPDIFNKIRLACKVARARAREAYRNGGKPTIMPQTFASTLLQRTMNREAWMLRQLSKGTLTQEDMEAEGHHNGIDFTADRAVDDLNVVPFNRQSCEQVAHDDFHALSNLQSYLIAQISNANYDFDPDSLCFFEQQELDEQTGQWHRTVAAQSFEEAESAMDDIVARMAEEQEAKEALKDNEHISFTA